MNYVGPLSSQRKQRKHEPTVIITLINCIIKYTSIFVILAKFKILGLNINFP